MTNLADLPQRADARFAVITGAGSGIGREVAIGLAQRGCDLLLVGRSAAKLATTRARIIAAWPGVQVAVHATDLSELARCRALASALADRPVDILVHNAGVFTTTRTLTQEGREAVLATNHLAPFVLTRALLPSLRAAVAARGEARVVITGSSTSDHARIDPADLELVRGWGMTRSYGRSKLAVLMAGFRQAAELAGSGITVNVVHPGLVATDLVRDTGRAGWGWRIVSRFALTPEQGADTLLWAATSPEMRGVSGCYLKQRRIVRPNPRAENAALVDRVWNATRALAEAS